MRKDSRKMKITAIISEFNPFHKGHRYLIDKAKENGATHIVAVMSGNFVQRGECSVFSKWDRTRTALENGVDLVVENPIVFATAAAQRFAYGGVNVIKAIGCVDEIAFGSECGDTDSLRYVAEIIANDDFKEEMKKLLSEGFSFPLAREKAVTEKYGKKYGKILSEPNNILACEYISECIKGDFEPDFFTVKRFGPEHDSDAEKNGFSSASRLRECLVNDTVTSDEIFEDMRRKCKAFDFTKAELPLLVKLRSFTEDDFRNLPDVSEGMENRLYSASQKATSISEFLDLVKTKRYTLSRIRRICLYALLGITKEDVERNVPYIRVLGFSEKGKEILRKGRDTALLPVVMKYSDIKNLDDNAFEIFEKESKATDIFATLCDDILPCGLEKTENIIKKSEKH